MSLMGSVDNGLAPVIPGQQEYMGDVRQDAQTVIDMIERQVDATVKRINPLLLQLNLPALQPPAKKGSIM